MAVSALGALLSTVTAATTGGTLIGSAALGLTGFAAIAGHFLITTALGAALNALAPKPKTNGQGGGYSANSIGSNLDYQVIYGRDKVGGVVVFNDTTGGSNAFLHRVIAIAGHEVDAIEEIWINDMKVTQLGDNGEVLEVELPDGSTSTNYQTHIKIYTKLGTEDQTAFQPLVDVYENEDEQLWTTNHRLRGIACAYAQFWYVPHLFPNGVPTLRFVVRGKKVYNPLTEVTEWSDNPALCIADYITSDYGLGESSSRVDWDGVAVASAVCDQTDTPTGEKRYTLNGAFVTAEVPADLLALMLDSMGGLLWYAQGKWRMKPAYWTSPVASYTEEDILGSINLSTRQSRRDNFNAVKGTFKGPTTNYQITDYPQINNHTPDTGSTLIFNNLEVGNFYQLVTFGDATQDNINQLAGTVGKTYSVGDIFQAADVSVSNTGTYYGTYDFNLQVDGGQRSTIDHVLPFTNSLETVKRLGRIVLERARQQLTLEITVPLKGFRCQVGDNINLSYTRWGWTDKPFEVLQWRFSVDEELAPVVHVTLRETAANIFDDIDDGEIYERDNTSLPNPFVVEAPDNLAATQLPVIQEDGTLLSFLELDWTHSNPGGVAYFEVTYSITGQNTWTEQRVRGLTNTVIGPLIGGIGYDIRVAAISTLGQFSAYDTLTNQIAGPDNTTPSAPTGLAGTGGYRTVHLTWNEVTTNTNATTALDIKGYNVYRNSTKIAFISSTSFSDGGLTAATSYAYQVEAVDYSGNVSAKSSTLNKSTLTDPADGVDGVSVLVIYSNDNAGTYQSLTNTGTAPNGDPWNYIQYYEYNTASGTPTLPVSASAGDFVLYVGVGQSVFPIYAADASGNDQSFTQGTREFVNFYEREGGPPTLPRSVDENGDPLIWVRFVGLQGPTGATGASGEDGLNGGTVAALQVYKRSSTAPTTPSGGSYNFNTNVLTPPSGWSITVPTGTDQLYVSLATAQTTGGPGTFNPVTDTTLSWSSPDTWDIDGQEGVTGRSVYNAVVYLRHGSFNALDQEDQDELLLEDNSFLLTQDSATTVPTAPTGGSFNFGTNVLTPPDTPVQWYAEIPDGVGTIWTSQFTFSIDGDTGTDPGGTWSTPQVLTENGLDGSAGVSTFVVVVFKRSATRPNVPTGGSYDFGLNSITPPSGWETSIPDGGAGADPVWQVAAVASIVGVEGIDSELSWGVPTEVARNGLDGDSGTDAPNWRILTDNQVFTFDRKGGATETVSNFTGTATNINNPVYTWTKTNDPNNAISITGSGSSRTITLTAYGQTFWNFPSGGITITGRVTGTDSGNNAVDLTDSIRIVAVKQGSGGITIIQSNSAHVVPAEYDGSNPILTDSGNIISVYIGADKATPLAAGATLTNSSFQIYNVAVSNVTGGTSYSIVGDDAVFGNITSMTADAGTKTFSIRVKDLDGDTSEYTAVQSFARSREGPQGVQGIDGPSGSSGLSVAQLAVYKRSATQPTTPTGGSFNFGTTTLTPPSGWSTGVPAGTDPVYISLGLASVQGTTGIDNSISWSTPTIIARNGEDGLDGAAGADGAPGADGLPGVNGSSTYEARIFKRATTQPATPDTGSFNFTTNSLAVPAGWDDNIPTGTDTVWSCTFLFQILGSSGIDYVNPDTWTTPVKYVEDGTNGEDGLSTFLASVYKRSATTPSNIPDPNTASYDFGTNKLTAPTGWFNYIPSGTDPLYVSTALASVQGTTGIDSTLTWTVPVIMARDGATGPNWRIATDNQAFTYNRNGSATETVSNFDGAASGITNPIYNWSKSSDPNSAITLTPSGSELTVTLTTAGQTFTNFPSGGITITGTVTGTDSNGNAVNLSDSIRLVALKQGSGGINILQSNSAHVIPTKSNGGSPDFTGSGDNLTVYIGATSATPKTSIATLTNGSFQVYNVTHTNCSGPTSYSIVGTEARFGVITDITQDTAQKTFYVRVKDFDGATSEYVVIQSLSRARAGVDGPTGDTGDTGERGPGRWNIPVASLPTTTAQAQAAWNAWVDKPGAPVKYDQAWFYTGTQSSPTGQSVWICQSVTNSTTHTWAEQAEVIDGNLLVTGTVTANALVTDEAVITGTAQIEKGVITTANIGDLQVGTLQIAGDAATSVYSVSTTTNNTVSTNIFVPSSSTVTTAKFMIFGFVQNLSSTSAVSAQYGIRLLVNGSEVERVTYTSPDVSGGGTLTSYFSGTLTHQTTKTSTASFQTISVELQAIGGTVVDNDKLTLVIMRSLK